MLDLNLNVASAESTQNEESGNFFENFPQGSGRPQLDESGTSNSSIANADASSNGGDDEFCSTRNGASDLYTFNFDILKFGSGGNESNEVVETKDLFPVVSGVDEVGLNGNFKDWQGQSTSLSSSSRKNWIELGFDQGGSVEMRMAQQPKPQPQAQQQQVKKSRRGPRSRSSQYRGVTFYRRTGRWESHIW